MYKQISSALLLFMVLGVISCSDTLNSNGDERSELEILEPLTEALMSQDQREIYGKGIFILNWSGINPRFSEDSQSLKMAMAIGFDEEVLLKPPYTASSVDMGTVTITSEDDEIIELTKKSSRFSGDQIVYSHRSFGPYRTNESLPYRAGGNYTLQASGSGVFPSLTTSVTAPEQQVTIVSPAADRVDSHSGDLTLTWDALPNNPVGIHIRPAINPLSGQGPGDFNREDSRIIILDGEEDSYTISKKTLSEIADKSNENAVHVSVGQLNVHDVETEGRTYRVLMKTADHRLVTLN